MRLNDIYIDSIGIRLGRSVDLADAVAEGRYDAKEYTANGLLRAVISDGEFAPDMAIAAVRQAMGRGDVAPEDIRMILHASVYFQGQDMWTPASYIQQKTIGGTASSIDVDQKSNGGMAALALGTAYLSCCDQDAALLLTSCDRFTRPGWDRYRTETGTVLGDSGTATVLSRRPGFARILSVVMTSDPTLEEMYRGDGLRTTPAPTDRPLNLRTRKMKYMRGRLRDLEAISNQIAGGVGNCMMEALAEAKVELDDVSRVVLPNIGQTVRWWSMLAELGVDLDRTTWEFGRNIGHLGAGDQVNSLNHLIEQGEIGVGDKVVLVGSGHGFNWGAAVVEILESPAWGGQSR